MDAPAQDSTRSGSCHLDPSTARHSACATPLWSIPTIPLCDASLARETPADGDANRPEWSWVAAPPEPLRGAGAGAHDLLVRGPRPREKPRASHLRKALAQKQTQRFPLPLREPGARPG